MTYLANLDMQDAVMLVTGVALGYFFFWWASKRHRVALEEEHKLLMLKAQREAEDLARETRLHATEEALKARTQAEMALAGRERETAEAESRLTEREKLINQQFANLVNQEKEFRAEQERVRGQSKQNEERQRELDDLTARRKSELETLAKMSADEARSMLLAEMEKEALSDANAFARHIMEEARVRAEDKARRLLATSIQRYAGEHTSETTTTSLALPSEELKGRIIGRDGRNIRAFEAATGVTVLIDDTPNAVVLSAFDPVRREIARGAMERLLADGRIHPTRIEEVVSKVKQETEESMARYGEEAVSRSGVPPLHPEIIKLLGSLRFRHSFSQNVLSHSVEVAHLTGLLAGELGLDVTLAKRAGLLHDIGKAVAHEVAGTHAQAGGEIARRYGEPEAVIHAVASHHDEVPQDGPLSVLVSAADAISASRPGARSETMSVYLKRVEDLEKIGMSFTGVEKVYAVQAGRELRVFVQPQQVNDEAAYVLARDLARKIENELHYPGQIRVTVMRETRCIEFAK